MRRLLTSRHGLFVLLIGVTFGAQGFSQTPSAAAVLALDRQDAILEGLPSLRVETTEHHSTRRTLRPEESIRHKLTIRVEDGRFFWENHLGLPPTSIAGDGFVYLLSREPGRYVRVQRINDRLTYVQHVDMGTSRVTYWGELRLALGH